MKYIFINTENSIRQIAQTDDSAQIITQSIFPAREQREGYKAVLEYNEAQGVYWNYIALTGAEKREAAYQTEKCIEYDGKMLTVDEANALWLHYRAENSPKASELTVLITTAKAEIRARFPD